VGIVKAFEPALLFIGTLYSDAAVLDWTKKTIGKSFGEVLFLSSSSQWDYSRYYKEELGWPIFRRFIFFSDLIDPGDIADIKLKTNEIENDFSIDGKRRINLDPGYLTLSKVVLASTKNYSHRIYLGKGIYGEVTLIYKDGKYSPHLFTYRDYQDKPCIDMFMKAREILKKMLS